LNLRPFLEWLASHLPPARVIYDREGVSPYLSRWYIIGRPRMADGSAPIDRFGNPKKDAIFPPGLGVYLHKFHRSDDDGALHNHPWRWARAVILAGGYREERRAAGDVVVTRYRRPLDVVRVDREDFHRVDLLESDSWSLFIAGPKASSWGFWDRDTGVFEHWRAYIDRLRASKREEARS
jgi:hypothetical protein